MSNEEIKAFAIKNGYKDIQEVGNYADSRVFVPVFQNDKKVIGYPQYILLKNDELIVKTDISMEITKSLINNEG